MSEVPRRAVLLSICVLVVVVSGATVVATQASEQATIKTSENSTNYLQPSESANKKYDEVSINVASAVDASAQELHTEADIRAFSRKMRVTPNQDQQRRIADRGLVELQNRYRTLDERQQTLFEEYSTGELSGVSLSHEIVQLRTAVNLQQQYRQELDTYADPSRTFLQDLNSLEQSLATRQPVTDRLESSMSGTRDTILLYAEGTEDALVMATVDNETYLRQATIRSERDLEGEDQFVDFWRDATDRTETLYPWTFGSDNIRGLDPFNLQQFSQIYAVRTEHTQGELTVYLDGATKNVFHENQLKQIDNLPITETVINGSGSLTVSVELTNQAGPMKVIVTNQAGVPVEGAPVTVNGTAVGVTKNDGELWAVQPSGNFEVGATTNNGNTGSVRVERAG